MKYLYLIWSGLKRKKTRTFLTTMSILIAFVLFGLVLALKRGLSQGAEVAGADRLVVRHKVSLIQLLPESYHRQIAQVSGVSTVVHSTWFGGQYQDPKNFFAKIPVEPEPFLDMYPEYVLPEDQLKAWLTTRTGAIVGSSLVERFGWKLGDRIPIQGDIWAKKDGDRLWEFDLVGIYEAGEKGADTSQMFFRYDYFDEARRGGRGLVGWYTVRIEDPDRAAEVAQAIDDVFLNSQAETKAEPEGAFVQAFANQVGNLGAISIAVLSLAFFTILLMSGNTMGQAVRERTSELGVLKAMGFTHRQVLGLVLGESMLLAMLGGLAGLALSKIAVSGMAAAGLDRFFPSLFVANGDLLIGAALVLVLGLFSGILPAWQAMRLRVADALRRS